MAKFKTKKVLTFKRIKIGDADHLNQILKEKGKEGVLALLDQKNESDNDPLGALTFIFKYDFQTSDQRTKNVLIEIKGSQALIGNTTITPSDPEHAEKIDLYLSSASAVLAKNAARRTIERHKIIHTCDLTFDRTEIEFNSLGANSRLSTLIWKETIDSAIALLTQNADEPIPTLYGTLRYCFTYNDQNGKPQTIFFTESSAFFKDIFNGSQRLTLTPQDREKARHQAVTLIQDYKEKDKDIPKPKLQFEKVTHNWGELSLNRLLPQYGRATLQGSDHTKKELFEAGVAGLQQAIRDAEKTDFIYTYHFNVKSGSHLYEYSVNGGHYLGSGVKTANNPDDNDDKIVCLLTDDAIAEAREEAARQVQQYVVEKFTPSV